MDATKTLDNYLSLNKLLVGILSKSKANLMLENEIYQKQIRGSVNVCLCLDFDKSDFYNFLKHVSSLNFVNHKCFFEDVNFLFSVDKLKHYLLMKQNFTYYKI